MEQLHEIYCHYTETLQAVKNAASPIAGIFGTGGGPSRHTCHTEFYDSVGRWAESFLASKPDEDSLFEAARYILMAGGAHKNLQTYWFVCAAQAHAKPMISLLSQQLCEELRQEYGELYPAASRLPLMQEMYDLLCRHACVAPKKKGLFSFLCK